MQAQELKASRMNPERWRRTKEILDITLRLPPAEREAYLTRVCEDDAELRAEVNSLLEAQEAAGDFLEKPLFREPADPVRTLRSDGAVRLRSVEPRTEK